MRISDWSSDVCSSDLRHYIGIEREDDYIAAARERIEMALPLDESTVKTMMAPQAATRVAFGMLVSDGLIAPGSVLTDSKRRWKATVRVDGSLDCDGQPAGSIHKVGAGVQGAPSCNGWTFWHVDDGKQLRVIDAVRQGWQLANEA